jgi:Zn/Cd-binding protein ZinT
MGLLNLKQKKIKEANISFTKMNQSHLSKYFYDGIAVVNYELGEYQIAKDYLLLISKNKALNADQLNLMKLIDDKLIQN